jgi:hypothetical protein
LLRSFKSDLFCARTQAGFGIGTHSTHDTQ